MIMRTDVGRSAIALGLALAALGFASGASAQDVDARWLPWIGCWEPTKETPDADLVCIRPSDQAGAVEILRIAGSDVVAREVVWADGRRHETKRESCTGWEEGAFSSDGRRVYLSSSHTCGEGVTQVGSGVFAFASAAEWLDIRSAGMGGETMAFVQRFRAADPALAEAAGYGDLLADRARSSRTARMVAAAAMDVDDVIEASQRLPGDAVEALLAERGQPLELSAAELVRMADSGVSPDVIDIAVAVSYPDHFRLNTADDQVQASALDQGSLRRRWAYAGPMYYDPFYAPWSFRYGYGYYGYGYGGYGYGYDPYMYGWGFGGYGYTPWVSVVEPAPRDHGRVINGRGYSRGSSDSGASRGSGSWSSGGAARSSGASSSGGSSSGGSSSGRTAHARGGGR